MKDVSLGRGNHAIEAQRWGGIKSIYGKEYQPVYLECMVQAGRWEGWFRL